MTRKGNPDRAIDVPVNPARFWEQCSLRSTIYTWRFGLSIDRSIKSILSLIPFQTTPKPPTHAPSIVICRPGAPPRSTLPGIPSLMPYERLSLWIMSVGYLLIRVDQDTLGQ